MLNIHFDNLLYALGYGGFDMNSLVLVLLIDHFSNGIDQTDVCRHILYFRITHFSLYVVVTCWNL